MEQTVGNLIRQQSNELQTLQATSPVSSLMIEVEQLRRGVLQKYGEHGAEVLDKYHADYLFRKQVSEEDCYFGDYPTLSQLKAQFDGKYPAAWLMAHLHDLSEYCGCKEKLTGHALQQCASVISTEFYFLKVTEVMLFFQRFKSGKYGRFYGSVDPIVITSAIRDFLKERTKAYNDHFEEEERKKALESEKTKCSWEDYCMKQYGEIRPHPLKRNLAQKDSPKATVKMEDESAILRLAKSIATDTLTDKRTKEIFSGHFAKKYECSPEEYIKNHE